MEDIYELLLKICEIGRQNTLLPNLCNVNPFKTYFSNDYSLDQNNLDILDNGYARRELLLRYLLLSAVLDQGPDIVGVRKLLIEVTNSLYQNEIFFIHHPLTFFDEIGFSVNQIDSIHQSVKEERSSTWALDNQTSAQKYNLFMDNTKQVLNYAVFRWGVPLILPVLLERNFISDGNKSKPLLSYLKSYSSAEMMSAGLKDHPKYGLGKAIGDKACHLYAKWIVSSFSLLNDNNPHWGPFSYEIPFDSNAGRIFWRTGFFLQWATIDDYIKQDVIQKENGKRGADYIRVTNIRGMKSKKNVLPRIKDNYIQICTKHLRTHSRAPQRIEIQRIPHAYLLGNSSKYGINDLDEGLIHLGTKYCFNHNDPRCNDCPISGSCEGNIYRRELITNYKT